MSLVEVYRSSGMLACEQRAFVLHAVGIESEIVDEADAFTLWVAPESASAAHEHLQHYNVESTATAQPKPVMELHRHAWIAPLLYAVVIVGAGYCAGSGLLGLNWNDAGALRSDVHRSGEWWRLVTALTLHVDHAHLLSNLGFGAFFSYLAARLLGSGIALVSIVFAAAIGNLLDSAWMPQSQVSMGASTMVFAALGLVAAYSWRQQLNLRMPWLHTWAHRWAPLIAGIMLLALIGSGGENTDVLAHLTGFFCGVILGVAFARVRVAWFRNVLLQTTASGIALGLIAGAWLWAGSGT